MDTSRSVIGVVLIKDGKPIAYVSKSFTPTQQREMELAVVFACQRFY